MGAVSYPVLRPIADAGVLVEFGDAIDDDVHQRVLNFDAAIRGEQFDGLTELIPTYASIFVGYDPLLTDFDTVSNHVTQKLDVTSGTVPTPTHWKIATCYEDEFAPDLDEVCEQLGMTHDAVIEQHLAGAYKVFMYGFAPGFAYLGGVPLPIHLPRKQAPVKDLPVGSVLIAGPQGLITTVVMPSGWWNIGRTHFNPLQSGSGRPFLFDVGDTLEFVRMSRVDFIKHTNA